MVEGPVGIAEVAALVGETARATMLEALLDGRALTATELAFVAGIGAPTASAHLARLVDGGLLTVVSQGRHRYFRLASRRVSDMVEGIMRVASMDSPRRYRPRGPRDAAMTLARSCYDHLAGRLGVAIADALTGHEHVVLTGDGGVVTNSGQRFLHDLGIDVTPSRGRRPICRPCLDWTERRPHLAGTLGTALADRCFALGWTERVRDSRAVRVTDQGRAGFRTTMGIDVAALAAA